MIIECYFIHFSAECVYDKVQLLGDSEGIAVVASSADCHSHCLLTPRCQFWTFERVTSR